MSVTNRQALEEAQSEILKRIEEIRALERELKGLLASDEAGRGKAAEQVTRLFEKRRSVSALIARHSPAIFWINPTLRSFLLNPLCKEQTPVIMNYREAKVGGLHIDRKPLYDGPAQAPNSPYRVLWSIAGTDGDGTCNSMWIWALRPSAGHTLCGVNVYTEVRINGLAYLNTGDSYVRIFAETAVGLYRGLNKALKDVDIWQDQPALASYSKCSPESTNIPEGGYIQRGDGFVAIPELWVRFYTECEDVQDGDIMISGCPVTVECHNAFFQAMLNNEGTIAIEAPDVRIYEHPAW